MHVFVHACVMLRRRRGNLSNIVQFGPESCPQRVCAIISAFMLGMVARPANAVDTNMMSAYVSLLRASGNAHAHVSWPTLPKVGAVELESRCSIVECLVGEGGDNESHACVIGVVDGCPHTAGILIAMSAGRGVAPKLAMLDVRPSTCEFEPLTHIAHHHPIRVVIVALLSIVCARLCSTPSFCLSGPCAISKILWRCRAASCCIGALC